MAKNQIEVGMMPSHPGGFIRAEVIEDLDIGIADAAGFLGVRVATLSDLLTAKSALSPEMAFRMEKAFGLNMDMLLRMQAWHDAQKMRERADDIAVERYVRA